MLKTTGLIKKLDSNSFQEYYFAVKIAAYMSTFYLLLYAVIAWSAPGGFYSMFVAEHLDFVSWYRGKLLWACALLLKGIGYPNYVTGQELQVINGVTVLLSFDCLGFGIISFWSSLVLSFPGHPKRKMVYLAIGLVTITVLNMLRVVILAIVYSSPVAYKYQSVDHHFIANVAIYIVFVLLGKLWLKKAEVPLNKK